MNQFKRGVSSKHSLGVGILANLKYITFTVVGTKINFNGDKSWTLLALEDKDLNNYRTKGKLDKKSILKNVESLYFLYKLENKFDSIEVGILFGSKKSFDKTIEESNEILMMS